MLLNAIDEPAASVSTQWPAMACSPPHFRQLIVYVPARTVAVPATRCRCTRSAAADRPRGISSSVVTLIVPVAGGQATCR